MQTFNRKVMSPLPKPGIYKFRGDIYSLRGEALFVLSPSLHFPNISHFENHSKYWLGRWRWLQSVKPEGERPVGTFALPFVDVDRPLNLSKIVFILTR